MNWTRCVTFRDWIDSEVSDVLSIIVYCWDKAVTFLDRSMTPG